MSHWMDSDEQGLDSGKKVRDQWVDITDNIIICEKIILFQLSKNERFIAEYNR